MTTRTLQCENSLFKTTFKALQTSTVQSGAFISHRPLRSHQPSENWMRFCRMYKCGNVS
jgi:hypothetical protein